MNHFGTRRWRGEPGRSGEIGPPGPPGINVLCRIFWPQINQWLQENQTVSYYFNTRTSGWIMKKGEITAIKNQINNEWNGYLSYGDAFGTLVSEFGQFSLEFKKEIYKIGTKLFPFGRPSYKTIIILNFKRSGSTEKEVILTDKLGYRQIYLYEGKVYFVCDDQIMSFRYVSGRWNTIYTELNDDKEMDSYFSVNCNRPKSFKIRKPAEDNFLYIGGWKAGDFFKGTIARIDLYFQYMDDAERFPRNLLNKYIYSNFILY